MVSAPPGTQGTESPDLPGRFMDGTLPQPGNTFSLAQIDDETEKRRVLAGHPDVAEAVFRLEDSDLLRGSLSAFELQPARLAARARTFARIMRSPELWWDVTGALLTVGDYQRPRGRDATNTRSYQFGTHSERYRDVWRTLLTGASRDDLAPTARVLGEFLDTVGEDESSLSQSLQTMQHEWLAEREAAQRFDWRYYMVKYRAMREGASGIYFAEGGQLGYSLCNLKGGRTQVNSWYRDPYLLTIWRQLGEPDAIEDPWFLGYEWSHRWLRFSASGVGLRCTDSGFVLSGPTVEEHQTAFDVVCRELAIGPGLRLRIPQSTIPPTVDEQDRVAVGAAVARRLMASGL